MAPCPEADRQVKGLREGQRPGVGPDPPGAGVGPARLAEHARAEIGAHGRPLAQWLEGAQARAGAGAHIQPPAEWPQRAQRGGRRVQQAIAGAERRVVELRGEQVIAALDRGQRLHRQLTRRRAPGREHGPRVAA